MWFICVNHAVERAFNNLRPANNCCLQALLDAGAEIEAKVAGNGNTALMTAAWNGRPKATTVLLDAGANAFAADSLGRNSLHLGAQFPSNFQALQASAGWDQNAGVSTAAAENWCQKRLLGMYDKMQLVVIFSVFLILQLWLLNGSRLNAGQQQCLAVWRGAKTDRNYYSFCFIRLQWASECLRTDAESPHWLAETTCAGDMNAFADFRNMGGKRFLRHTGSFHP